MSFRLVAWQPSIGTIVESPTEATMRILISDFWFDYSTLDVVCVCCVLWAEHGARAYHALWHLNTENLWKFTQKMAEFVELRTEEMLPEVEQMERMLMFEKDELR